MRIGGRLRSVPSLAFALSWAAAADTIVLKNGRRIVAEDITEDASHVTYQTPAGELSIPKSIVARIEHDNFAYSSTASAAPEPPIGAPQIEHVRGYEDVAALGRSRQRHRFRLSCGA